MDDTLDKFKLSKPAKDFKEKMNNVKGGALNTFNKVGAGLKSFGQATKEKASNIKTDGFKEKMSQITNSFKKNREQPSYQRRAPLDDSAMK